MKKIIFLSLIIPLIIGSCAKEEKSPIEGTWEIVYFSSPELPQTFPAQVQGSQIKIFTKEHFVFAGQFNLDTVWQDNYGWGTYTLDGNKYSENVVLHASKPTMGQTVRILVEVRNDTLTQSYPTDENWNLPEKYSIEKYVRVK